MLTNDQLKIDHFWTKYSKFSVSLTRRDISFRLITFQGHNCSMGLVVAVLSSTAQLIFMLLDRGSLILQMRDLRLREVKSFAQSHQLRDSGICTNFTIMVILSSFCTKYSRG